MADNNTVELVVKVTDQATSPLRELTGSLNDLSRHVTGLDIAKFGTLAGVVGAAAEAMNLVVHGSAELQDATFRLDNVFQAFSKTIGQSRNDLEEFANTAREGSRFSNIEIINAQQTLLKYGTITGETFKRAEQAALDLGAQLKDLGQASYILGRALAAPEQSARLLRQAGVVLTEQQKAQIKAFEDLGDKAGSANIILSEIEKRYSGTALKDLQTMTGAWGHLANTFKEMFENTGIATGMANTLNFLDKALRDTLLLDQISKEHLKNSAEAENQRIAAQSGSFRGSSAKDDSPGPLSAKDQLKKISADSALKVAELGQAMAELAANGSDLEKMKSDDEDHIRSLGKAYDEAAAEVEKFRKEQQQLTEDLANDPLGFSAIMSETEKMIQDQGKAVFKQMDQDEKDAERIHKNMLDNVQNIFANFFVTLKGGFKGLLSAFGEMLLQMVAQAAAADLTKALFGGSAGGGGGGVFGALASGAMAYFSGGASVAAGAGGAAAGAAGSSGIIGPRASGGDTSGLTLVGEEGPELIATGSARVMNSRQMAFAGGNGGGSMNFAPVTNIVIQAKDGDASSLRTEFYTAIDMNNKKLKGDIYNTMDRNGLGKMR